MIAAGVDNLIHDPPEMSQRGTPTWEMALFYPQQGEWTEEDYLSLDTNWFVEFDDGCVEVLPMPLVSHQLLADFLLDKLKAYVASRRLRGRVMFGPVKVRLKRRKYREPDVMFVAAKQFGKDPRYVKGAEFVIEIVSPGERNRKRDLVQKRAEYAAAGIAEYWIVDPELEQVTVLVLVGKGYRTHGRFSRGGAAGSKSMKGFEVDVNALFDAGIPPLDEE